MRESITCYDLPILLSRGFKYGIDDTLLWGKCRDGNEWQAFIQGEFITFSTRQPNSRCMESHRRMTRREFDERFAA